METSPLIPRASAAQRTAAIWVPPARTTFVPASPFRSPRTAGIMGSPTSLTALRGSDLMEPKEAPHLSRAASTISCFLAMG